MRSRATTAGNWILSRFISHVAAKAGYPVRCRFSVRSQASLEYWVTRTSAQSRTRRVTTADYAAGTGNAVTDLIFSIAKREVTFFSGTALISFL